MIYFIGYDKRVSLAEIRVADCFCCVFCLVGKRNLCYWMNEWKGIGRDEHKKQQDWLLSYYIMTTAR